MNLIRQYEFGLITIEELENCLWDFGPNAIAEVSESCFQFYIDLVLHYHDRPYYIKPYYTD